MLCKRQYGPLLAAVIMLTIGAGCNQAPQPLKLAPAPSSVPAAATPAPADNQSITVSATPSIQTESQATETPVRILLIHYRGSLQPLGCCNRDMYERDEFVAIQNTSKISQNVAGWKLMNITRGYPSFTFPAYFPCLPFTPSKDNKFVANSQNYVSNAPQTVERVFAATQSAPEPVTSSPSEINWSGCVPIPPLDETPMAAIGDRQQGRQVPCVLYPGQILLLFTDEIHCQYGGLSFKYGEGNIWNNEQPDTAVLYNSQGQEVSRKSYSVGR